MYCRTTDAAPRKNYATNHSTPEDCPQERGTSPQDEGHTIGVPRDPYNGAPTHQTPFARSDQPFPPTPREYGAPTAHQHRRTGMGGTNEAPQDGTQRWCGSLQSPNKQSERTFPEVHKELEKIRETLQQGDSKRTQTLAEIQQYQGAFSSTRGHISDVQGGYPIIENTQPHPTHHGRGIAELYRRQITRNRFRHLKAKLFATEYDYVNANISITVLDSADNTNKRKPRHRITTENQRPDYPLYTPKMPAINMSWAHGISELEVALKWMQQRTPYIQLLRHLPRKMRRRFENLEMIPYETQLLEADIIEPARKEEILSWCKIFRLLEPVKQRYRLIIEPRDLNDAWKLCGFPHTDLPQIEDIRELVLAADEISVADLKCYYYQLELSEQVRNCYGIQIGRKYYRLKRLPMGASISVYVAHTISQFIHRGLLPGGTRLLTYIDNWYAAGNMTKMYSRAPAILSENLVGTAVTILGLDVDTVHKTIQLGKKYARHVDFLQKAMSRDLTHTEMWKVLGVVMRYILVASRPLHDKYFMLCMIRRASRNLALDETGDLWDKPIHCSPKEKAELSALVNEACQMKKYKIVDPRAPKEPTVIFTDASAKSWGVVRIENSTLHVSSGALREMPIHEGEAQAVLEGLEECHDSNAIAIIVDNSIVAQAITKGHSSNKAVNTLCGVIAKWPVRIAVAWIPSEENWADGPSRSKPVRLAEISSLQFQPAKQWLSVCIAASPPTSFPEHM
ncbi:unnamed protein product [Bodo saltans]|uniref:Uncharacterized protein n=1 Tax=Bodo saltans TaxID=75058 RepID=A0A0S4KHA8_BODSA|nr:unnamed protein product [Bodo saltans]|eukprot:CUI11119.1 unnamed protein product [Bodo saltans]